MGNWIHSEELIKGVSGARLLTEKEKMSEPYGILVWIGDNVVT